MTHADAATVIRCGTFIDGTGAPARHDVALTVHDGRVMSVQEWDCVADSVRDDFYDASTASVTPGIIDGHAHLCDASASMPGARPVPDDIDIVTWGLAAGTSALTSGITTVVDAGSPRGLAVRVSSLITAGTAVGPTVMAAGPAITTTAGHGTAISTTADTAEEMVAAVRSRVGSGAHLIKIMVTGGADDATPTNRRRAQYTESQLAAGIADAHRLGVKVIGHANATEGISRAVAAGIDIVAHCNWLGASPGTIDVHEPTVRMMLEQGTRIDLNIEGALRDLASTDGVPIQGSYGTPTPATRWELLAPLRAMGIGLHLTSDAYGPAIATFPRSLCRLRQRWGLSAQDLVALVTGAPAAALGILDERGTLTPGCAADLVIFNGDLEADPQAILEPLLVMRDGVPVVRSGLVRPSQIALSGSAQADAQQQRLDQRFAGLS